MFLTSIPFHFLLIFQYKIMNSSMQIKKLKTYGTVFIYMKIIEKSNVFNTGMAHDLIIIYYQH